MAGHHHHHCRKKTFWSRRDFLFQSGGGIAGLALADLLQRERLLAAGALQPDTCDAPVAGNPFAPEAVPLRAARHGGHLAVHERRREPGRHVRSEAGADTARGPAAGRLGSRAPGHPGPLMPSPFTFQRYGESGIEVSDIFPHLARKVDGMAFIRSL